MTDIYASQVPGVPEIRVEPRDQGSAPAPAADAPSPAAPPPSEPREARTIH